jgi:hypothetical protein
MIAALAAGVINALVGGGMFLVFPALLLSGVPPIVANATATSMLTPGGLTSFWIYRDRMTRSRRFQIVLVSISVIGAWLGSELLLHTPEKNFDKLVPYLMLLATVIFASSKKLAAAAASHSARTTHYVPLIACQFIISIYGGYFGAGMGILMMALYLLAAHMDLHEASTLRLLCATAANIMATLVFAARGIVEWQLGLPMIFACIAGGYWGARMVKRMDQEKARRVILACAWLMTLWLFVRSWLN